MTAVVLKTEWHCVYSTQRHKDLCVFVLLVWLELLQGEFWMKWFNFPWLLLTLEILDTDACDWHLYRGEKKTLAQLPSSGGKQWEMAALMRSKKDHMGDTRGSFQYYLWGLTIIIRYWDESHHDMVMNKMMEHSCKHRLYFLYTLQ